MQESRGLPNFFSSNKSSVWTNTGNSKFRGTSSHRFPLRSKSVKRESLRFFLSKKTRCPGRKFRSLGKFQNLSKREWDIISGNLRCMNWTVQNVDFFRLAQRRSSQIAHAIRKQLRSLLIIINLNIIISHMDSRLTGNETPDSTLTSNACEQVFL